MLTLACVDPNFILFVLLLMPLVPIGLCFYLYAPLSFGVKALAKGPLHGRPLALFAAALGIGVAVSAVGGLALYFISGSWMHEFNTVYFAGAGLFGWLCWNLNSSTRNAKAHFDERLRKARGIPMPAKPKFQIWFQDLTVAILCLGTGLALGRSYANTSCFTTQEFLLLASYLLMASVVALLVAVDVCRRSATGHDAIKRAGIFASIFALFPLTLPAAIPAWWMWRRALKAQTL